MVERHEWPTPTANGSQGGMTGRNGEKRHAQDSAVSLAEAARCWPTPRAGDGESGMEQFFRGPENPTLLGAVRKWPTPTAGDSKSSGSRNLPGSSAHAGTSLTDAVVHGGGKTPRKLLYPTPTATPYGSSQNGINGIGGEKQRPSAATPSLETVAKKQGGQLNASWVENLMGFPPGWTDFPPDPAKRKKHGKRRASSRRKRIRSAVRD
jgi:hypothetical protein